MKAQFGINVVEDASGINLLDKKSFVVTMRCNIPIRQIAMDIATPDGPAGMPCDGIEGDGVWKDIMKWEDGEAPFTSNEPSPAVLDYANRAKELKIEWKEYFDKGAVYLAGSKSTSG